jgi:hypothetical protein
MKIIALEEFPTNRPFTEIIKDYPFPNQIVLYEGPWNAWLCHPEGIVIQKRSEFFLNGTEKITTGMWDAGHPINPPIINHEEDKLMFEGHILYQGGCSCWTLHSLGVVVQSGDRFLFVSFPNKTT